MHSRTPRRSAAPVPCRRTSPFPFVALAAALALWGCHDDRPEPTPGSGGLPAGVVSSAVREVDFMRAWAELTVNNWAASAGPPGAGWSYAAGPSAWRQEWSGYSSVFVGGSAGSGELRNAFTQRLEVRLFHGQDPVREYAAADRLRLDLTQEVTRYSLPTGYPLEDPHQYSTGGTFQVEGLGGPRRVITGTGQQTGADRLCEEGAWRQYAYAASFQLSVAGDAAAPFCAAETLSATVDVRDTGNVTLDRFAGRFTSAAGGDLYTGELVSEQGPWKYIINGHRSCAEPPHAWPGMSAKY